MALEKAGSGIPKMPPNREELKASRMVLLGAKSASIASTPKEFAWPKTCKPLVPARPAVPARRKAAPGWTVTMPEPRGLPAVPVTCNWPASTLAPPLKTLLVPEMISAPAPALLSALEPPTICPMSSSAAVVAAVVGLKIAALPWIVVVPATRKR